ncbi:DUF1499 domain-containing protein [Pseudodesulfovibrio karagichevae]|uniref:DUF1499 domain-containing protein n=1 Tax=Pseudodesulfovibrio karagichevae TaxID=3239305 RepID=A0ABV4JY19_9BACT
MKQLLLTTLFVVSLAALGACSTKIPNLGMTDGKFALCPAGVDCVSSQATYAKNKIDPIKATGDPNKVMVDLGKAVESVFGGRVLLTEGNYLRAEFKSSVLRTMDDAEFYYDQKAGVIQVHALSRGEVLDFSDSRDRIEEIRMIFSGMQ